jgi:glycosyltransferase involved in cell wall biosynthesis
VRHPWRSLLRLIPLRLKEAANRAAGKPVFDLSFYMQFQPRSLMLGPVLVEPLRYCPRPAAGRARAAVIVPHLGMGGAESVLLEMIASLPRDRFEILVLATQSRDDRWRARWAACAEHIYDLAALVPPDRMTGALYSIVMNWKCDLVVVQNSLAGYSAIPQIKRDLPSAAAMDIIHALDEQWDQVACTAGVGPYLDWRVAFSGSVRRRLLAAGTPAGRLRSLRSGVDLERFVPAPAAPGGALHRILFAGRLDPVKRPILLVEVAARLRALRPEGGFQFVIAGDGPEMPRFRRAVHRAGLDPFFDFRGEVAEMAPLYPAADILILVSRAEGVPLVLAEAMACARPVVASNVGDVAELLDSSCGILIDVSRREALHFAVALDTLLRQPRLRASLGKEARRRIVAHCDIRKMRDEYAALFVDALESSRQPDPAPSVDDA